jgi:hypothetical protein
MVRFPCNTFTLPGRVLNEHCFNKICGEDENPLKSVRYSIRLYFAPPDLSNTLKNPKTIPLFF